MLNTEALNNLLNSLNLQIERMNGEYFIHNYNSNITDRIISNGKQYEYTFIKDETIYHLTITNNSITLKNNLRESITFNKEGFQYCEKESNEEHNKSLVTINRSLISFFKQDILKGTQEPHHAIGVKAHTGRDIFILYKASEDIGINGTLKKDTLITYEDDKVMRKDTTRHYNEQGKMTNGSVQDQEIDADMDEYIIQELLTHPHIEELLSRIDTILPEVSTYLLAINPNLEPIILKHRKTKSL